MAPRWREISRVHLTRDLHYLNWYRGASTSQGAAIALLAGARNHGVRAGYGEPRFVLALFASSRSLANNYSMNEEFMREAIRISVERMRANEGGPFGAVLVREGRIIARGWNRVTSTNDPTAHAEVTAIREACRALGDFKLTGCELYSSCEPCPMCLAAIYWARVDRLYFAAGRRDAADAGFDDDFLYREVPLPPEERSLPTKQLLRPEAVAAFAEWKAKPDKVPY
jgi:tRNA(Arg) A34 adenosine deaminase TadA